MSAEQSVSDLPLTRLQQALASFEQLAVAVSGGVDSMTLAWVAGRLPDLDLHVMHAVSPAVPTEATERVRQYAQAHDWPLTIIDAGEYQDPEYRANPVNRCYYCKNNLYAAIREATDMPVAAGTNTDDLGEYRPGLLAADEHGIYHPFVQADINKTDVRAIAAQAGLDDIAQLPAQPCLASRVETGISIRADDLSFVHRVEKAVVAIVGAGDVRCRVTGEGVWVEAPDNLTQGFERQIDQQVRAMCDTGGRQFAGLRPYRRGSAFLIQPDT